MEPKQYVSDYRLNERHYGALQGYVKSHVEEGRYGHDYHSVQAWRRSWYAVPPLLDENDPRRIQEIKQYANYCGGRENVPRGESLAMVANDRIRPFLDSVLHPIMSKAAETKQSHGQMISSPSGQDSEHVNNDKAKDGGCGLVVAHANSLRALIGVICQVENDEIALKRLEAMKIETGVPLVLKYRQLEDGNYEACDVEEVTGLNHVGSPDLPVWPLSCIPKTYLTQSQQYQYERTIEMEKKVHVGQRRSSKKIRIDVI
jgi:bisphosphoglycerate-dependent phosphoglycerate mutase